MIILVTTHKDIVAGTMRPADIACPACQAKGGLKMDFLRHEANHSMVFLVRSPCHAATLECERCKQEIPHAQWTGPLKLFFETYRRNFGRWLAIRPTKILLAFIAFMVVAAIWVRYDMQQSQTSGRDYQTSRETITRAITAPKPGMIWLVSYTRPEDVGPRSATSTHRLVQVERAEGNTVTVRFHHTAAEPLTGIARNVSGTEDANFTGPQVTLQRVSNTMFRIVSGITTAPNEPNMFITRIVKE